jgi:hypothetical protein
MTSNITVRVATNVAAIRLAATDFITILPHRRWPGTLIAWLEEVSAYVATAYDIARSGRHNTENNSLVSWWNSEIYI